MNDKDEQKNERKEGKICLDKIFLKGFSDHKDSNCLIGKICIP